MSMHKLKLLEIMARIPLFKGLSAGERELILNAPAGFAQVVADHTFINEGEFEPFFYIVMSGKAEVKHDDHVVAVIEPGQFIGEVGFICRELRTASVTALTDMIVMRIDGGCFQRLPIKIREIIKDKVIEGLVERVTKQTQKLIDVSRLEPVESLKMKVVNEVGELVNAPEMKSDNNNQEDEKVSETDSPFTKDEIDAAHIREDESSTQNNEDISS